MTKIKAIWCLSTVRQGYARSLRGLNKLNIVENEVYYIIARWTYHEYHEAEFDV